MEVPANPHSQVTDANAAQPDVLPEHWPQPSAMQPVRPVWIPWVIAVALAPLFWLMPKRFGPHFAAAGWRAAIAAHVVWGIYGAATVGMTAIAGPWYGLVTWLSGRTAEQMGRLPMPVPTFSEIVRAPLAYFVNGMALASGRPGPVGWTLAGLLTIVLAIAAGIVVLAMLLMPYIAAGERTRRLLGRTVRLVMWATTSLVVLGWAMQAVMLVSPNLQSDWTSTVLPAIYIVWAISLVLRGGARYAGKADGPAWQPQTPRCEGCGYSLTALPVSGTCPECGEPVAESLPATRQRLEFAAAESLPSRIKAYCPTCWAVLSDRTFFRRLALGDGLAPARRFAVWTCVFASLALLGLVQAIAFWKQHWLLDRSSGGLNGLEFVVAEAALLVTLLLSLGLLTLLTSRFGWRDIRPRAVAVFYWSAWLLPLLSFLLLTSVLIAWLLHKAFFSYAVQWLNLGRLDLYDLLVMLLVLIPALALWRATAAMLRAVRQMRYASR